MKKIGYILYCIFIIVISITINIFIGNSDRKLDYIMNDVIEHHTSCEEEETCPDKTSPDVREHVGSEHVGSEHIGDDDDKDGVGGEDDKDDDDDKDGVGGEDDEYGEDGNDGTDGAARTGDNDTTDRTKSIDTPQFCKDGLFTNTWSGGGQYSSNS